MPLRIEDENPVSLQAAFDGSSQLFLLHEEDPMASTAPHIQLDLTQADSSGLYHTQFKIDDFVEDSVTQNVYAHRVLADGSLAAWTRVSNTVESPPYSYSVPPETTSEEFDLMTLAVPAGGSAPTYTTKTAAEQAGARTIRIKIVKHGSRPDIRVQRR